MRGYVCVYTVGRGAINISEFPWSLVALLENIWLFSPCATEKLELHSPLVVLVVGFTAAIYLMN